MALASVPRKRQAGKARAVGRSTGEATSSAISTFQTRLVSIESALSNSSDLNPLYDLIQLIRSEADGQTNVVALQRGIKFLVRSLQVLLNDGRIPLTSVDEQGLVQGSFREAQRRSEADKAVADWLRQRWNEAAEMLCAMLMHGERDIRLLSLSSLMALQRDASSQLCSQLTPPDGEQALVWCNSPWTMLMTTLVSGDAKSETGVPQDVTTAFAEDYLEQFDDVRYVFCRDVSSILRTPPASLAHRQNLRANAIAILWNLTAVPTREEDLNKYLVKELQAGQKAKKKAGGKKEKKRTDVNGDEEGEEDEVEDWFSDSDDEGGKRPGKSSSSAGLGKVAQSAASASRGKRQRKRNPPLREAVYSLNAQKAVFSRAWLAVLLPLTRTGQDGRTMVVGGSLSLAMMHEALVRMHSQILPHLVKPNLLHDFLVDCLDAGGATSLLALNALFSLMTTHNLNYPSFYPRLYSLLQSDPPFLHVRYRSRFLRLLDVFLSSTHLPAALVASFAKRLSRVALRAPPAAIVVVIPFVWNLCKRHKQCLGLLHREFGGDRFDLGPAGVDDPFDAAESDPLKTGAIDSSLWELAAMGASLSVNQESSMAAVAKGGDAHYLASVSSLSKILAEPFTKERYDLEDFLDLTYGTLFETETAKTLRRREGKKVVEPALVYALPNRQGKRLPLLGAQADDEVPRKRARVQEEVTIDDGEEEADEDTRTAQLAMQEVQESLSEHDDACARLFSL